MCLTVRFCGHHTGLFIWLDGWLHWLVWFMDYISANNFLSALTYKGVGLMCESDIFRSKHNISIFEPIFKMLSRYILYQIYVLHKRQLMTLIIYAFQCSHHKCI